MRLAFVVGSVTFVTGGIGVVVIVDSLRLPLFETKVLTGWSVELIVFDVKLTVTLGLRVVANINTGKIEFMIITEIIKKHRGDEGNIVDYNCDGWRNFWHLSNFCSSNNHVDL